jgi:hypothetical protein|tara:strand:- start:33 stop:239 length:207 start_codon:yes stop_codon:yes gene_type:complete
MKNSFLAIKDKIVTKYLLIDHSLSETKSTNINVLLNRVRLDQKKEGRKKLLFTAITSLSVVLFGVLIF